MQKKKINKKIVQHFDNLSLQEVFLGWCVSCDVVITWFGLSVKLSLGPWVRCGVSEKVNCYSHLIIKLLLRPTLTPNADVIALNLKFDTLYIVSIFPPQY